MESSTTMPLPVVITQEMVGNKRFFLANCPVVDISSFGKSFEEATKNIKEALDLYFEDEDAKQLKSISVEVTLSHVVATVPKGVVESAKATSAVK